MARSARKITLCISLLGLVSIGCNSKRTSTTTPESSRFPTSHVRYTPRKPPSPRYGWRPLADTEIELQAMEYRRFDLPPKGLIRVSVNADSAVFGGAFDRDGVQTYIQGRNQLRQDDFATAPCPLVAVIRGAAECRTDDYNALTYIIRDKRSEMAMGGGLFFALHGATRPLQRATTPNRVSISIDVWDCIANCPVEPSASSPATPDEDTAAPADGTQ